MGKKSSYAGLPVNDYVGAPSPPGDWVDEEECTVCKYRFANKPAMWKYKRFISTACFAEEARAMRTREEGKAYVSRGPVLWRMRVKKLNEWYQEHRWCGSMAEDPPF